MSWFGGGDKTAKKQETHSFPEDGYNNSSSQHTEFAAPSSFPSSSSGGGDSGGNFQQIMMQEQQKALIQAVMFKLTEISFEQCVPKPSSSLSSGESNCIHAVVTKYLESAEFVAQALNSGK